jgi:hypothetical protein
MRYETFDDLTKLLKVYLETVDVGHASMQIKALEAIEATCRAALVELYEAKKRAV